jgi:hypothetical protein
MASSWIEEENARAKDLAKTGGTSNNNAPRLILSKKKVTPARVVKNLYIQESHIRAFDTLVFSQKMLKGKNAPELAEEAIELLLKQYNAKF